jgi:ATP-dependent exoDNAse (exonuclease V) beta subunit
MVLEETILPGYSRSPYPKKPHGTCAKVEKLLQGKEVIVKTFHSFCSELIKDYADRCKVPGDFKIFEEIDSMCCIYIYYYEHLKFYAIGG